MSCPWFPLCGGCACASQAAPACVCRLPQRVLCTCLQRQTQRHFKREMYRSSITLVRFIYSLNQTRITCLGLCVSVCVSCPRPHVYRCLCVSLFLCSARYEEGPAVRPRGNESTLFTHLQNICIVSCCLFLGVTTQRPSGPCVGS